MAPKNEPAETSDSAETRRQIRELSAASVRRHKLTPRTPEHAAALDIEHDLESTIWRRLSMPERRAPAGRKGSEPV